jgi:predicted transposase YdaD
MSELNNPHDAFFKKHFGNKKIAQNFLENYLPSEITKVLDLNYLTKENNRYVDRQQKTFNELFESCMLYLMYTRDDINIERVREVAKKVMDERGELIMTIAEKLKNEGMKKGIEKGKLEGEKDFAIRILSKRFGNQLTEEIKEKIRKADEKTIDYIGDNLLEITIEELKELLK